MLLYFLITIILLAVFFKNPSKGMVLAILTQPTISLFKIGRGYSPDFVIAVVAFIYLIVNSKRYFSKKSVCPFLIGLGASLFSYVVSGFYNGQSPLIRILASSCYDYLLAIDLWYLYKPTKSNNKFLFSTLIIYGVILSLYGIQEAITAQNPFIQYMYNKGFIGVLQEDSYVRFGIYRAQSLTIWVSSFGTVCCFALVFILLSAFKGIIKFNIKVYIIAVLLIASVFITGSRTMIAMTVIALCATLPYFYKKPRYIILFVVMIFIFIVNNPEYVNNVLDSFLNPEDAGGSSVQMRQYQLAAALSYYYNSPIFGNGIDFITVVENQSSDILGAESIIFKTLVDRGTIGMVTLAFLYVNVIYVLIKRKFYFLCFVPLAFVFGKVTSLLPGQTEVYGIFWTIMLLKLFEGQKEDMSEKRKNVPLASSKIDGNIVEHKAL